VAEQDIKELFVPLHLPTSFEDTYLNFLPFQIACASFWAENFPFPSIRTDCLNSKLRMYLVLRAQCTCWEVVAFAPEIFGCVVGVPCSGISSFQVSSQKLRIKNYPRISIC